MTVTLEASDDLTFDAAADLVLTYLREEAPLALWAVTRIEKGKQVYLYLGENGYGLKEGLAVPWEDTLCIHMAAGTAPAIAPDVSLVPQYAAAEADLDFRIGCYAGTLITEGDGAMFGAICGLDPSVRSGDSMMTNLGPQLMVLGRMLSMVLVADRRRDQYASALLRAQLEAETDGLTGVLNRAAWQRITTEEQARLSRYAQPMVALVLDLDLLKQVNDTQGHAAGDAYIRTAAQVLRRTVRLSDVVARVGGDEFAALLLNCSDAEASRVVDSIRCELADAGVSASIGVAAVEPKRGVLAAVAEADTKMYAAKAERRAYRDAPARYVGEPV